MRIAGETEMTSTIKSVPKPTKKERVKKKRSTPLPKLIKKADIIFSKFIRNRDAEELKGKCCTCGDPASQAGHFIKRSWKKIRFHPQNVHAQCARCNHYLDGNEAEYSRFIIERYGLETFNWLLSQKVAHKLTREEVQKVIEAYS